MHTNIKLLILAIPFGIITHTIAMNPARDEIRQWAIDKEKEQKDQRLRNVLDLAIRFNEQEPILRYLAIEALDQQLKDQSLLSATSYEREEIVSLLLGAKANANALDTEGETPLCKAALLGNIAIATTLKIAGADITPNRLATNKVRLFARSPLECAIDGKPGMPVQKQLAMIVWFIEHGAKPMPGDSQASPRCCAHPEEVTKLLAELRIEFGTFSPIKLVPYPKK